MENVAEIKKLPRQYVNGKPLYVQQSRYSSHTFYYLLVPGEAVPTQLRHSPGEKRLDPWVISGHVYGKAALDYTLSIFPNLKVFEHGSGCDDDGGLTHYSVYSQPVA